MAGICRDPFRDVTSSTELYWALRALGGTGRVTTVTSSRPCSSLIEYDAVLTTVRPISELGELYVQFSEYRFDMPRAVFGTRIN
ncbi:hypothetical protein BDW75DRAFT_122809 [Aspergillus navahoensis]